MTPPDSASNSAMIARPAPDPARMRRVFGENLRQLAGAAPSITALARALGINRTQFNRYLAGESFPRPDVLYRICQYFDTDARILTHPIAEIAAPIPPPRPLLSAFFGPVGPPIGEDELPSGFYRMIRRSFLFPEKYVRNVVLVRRQESIPFLRGYESKTALTRLGMENSLHNRVFQGPVARRGNGFIALVGRQLDHGVNFQYFAPADIPSHMIWEGFIASPTQERPNARRVSRIMYEYLAGGVRAALPLARSGGMISPASLSPLEKSILRPDALFS